MKVLRTFVLGSKYLKAGEEVNRTDFTDSQYKRAYEMGLIDPDGVKLPEGVEPAEEKNVEQTKEEKPKAKTKGK